VHFFLSFERGLLNEIIISPCFNICFVDVKYLPDDDQDRSKHVGSSDGLRVKI
jgi:hypothetical protein